MKGVEISDVRKTTCAGMGRAGRVVQGTLDRIPFPDESFDVVFSSEVLEHVPPNLAAQSVGLELKENCESVTSYFGITR